MCYYCFYHFLFILVLCLLCVCLSLPTHNVRLYVLISLQRAVIFVPQKEPNTFQTQAPNYSNMPTLMEINNTPSKAEFLTPRDAKKSAASDEEIPLLHSEDSESNDEVKKSANTKVRSEKKASDDTKGKSRKRGDRQISIFESIGVAAPAETITPKSRSKGDTNADSSKKKRKRVITPKYNSFPICIHITAEGKETKKVMITCHGIKNDFNDDIVDQPIVIVLKEKRALPKDPVARFLVGFGRYIH